jgi:NAD(P)-dependent dehydrogenase (short-subunit alcohol dehydrogenase family)
MTEKANGMTIAIVTGGSSGLGFAIARKLVAQKIFTVITGRDNQRLKSAHNSLGELCYPVQLDITQLNRIPGVILKLKKQFGRIDILVNNAGINLKKDLIDVSDEEFQQVILTNLTGVFAISREVSKIMIDQKQGNIVNISSMAAHYGLPKVVAYAASKGAVEAMTRTMAVELSPKGVLVNCVAPGFVKTNMSSAALNKDPERKRRVLKRTPLGKLGSPEDIANAVYFLVSDQNLYITGAVIPVDGGNSIGF